MISFRLLLLGLLLFSGVSRLQAQSAPEPEPLPAIKALLPPARDVHGLGLQITGAGFGSPASVFNNNTYPESGFYFSYSLAQKNAAKKDDLDAAVSLNGLFAPDGAPVHVSALAAHTYFFADVSPTWKSVRAEFEVRNLLSAPQDAGRNVSHWEVRELALPELNGNEATSAPTVEIRTNRGTTLRLEKLTRQKSDGVGGSSLFAFWKIARPKNAPEAEVKLTNVRVTYDNGSDSGDTRPENFDILLQSFNVPSGATSVSYSFDLVESARKWRKIGAFERVSFEIPVAAVWKIAPLPPQVPFVPSVVGHNDDFEVRWDAGYQLGNSSQNITNLRSRLWMRDVHPDPKAGAWTPTTVWVAVNKITYNPFMPDSPSEGVFHANGSLKKEGEVGYGLNGGTFDEPAGGRTDLHIVARRARTFFTTHILKNVPLPLPNQMQQFGPNQFFDGSWPLRRVMWIDDPRLQQKFELTDDDQLLLTFDRDPKTFLPESNMTMVGDEIFYDEKGKTQLWGSTFFDGDPIEKGHDKDRVTLIVSPPESGTKSLSGNFRVRHQAWNGDTKTLLLPDVPLGVRPGVETNP